MLSTNEVVNKYAALSAWRDVCLIMVLVVVCLVEGQRQTVTDCVQLTGAVRPEKLQLNVRDMGMCVYNPALRHNWGNHGVSSVVMDVQPVCLVFRYSPGQPFFLSSLFPP